MSQTRARFIVGDARAAIGGMPDRSVQSVITSPPYLAKRSYLAADDPHKALEVGREGSPAEFLGALLALTDDLWRVVRDDGTIWFNLGDTASGAAGYGSPESVNPAYSAARFAERWEGRAAKRFKRKDDGWPLAKSVCWIPQLFGASLAYGRNLLTGEPCRQWVTRPPVTWCKPNPPVGEIIDKFREATELIVWAAKTSKPGGYYFDLDSIREPNNPDNDRTTWNQQGPKQKMAEQLGKAVSGRERFTKRTCNEKGKPPNDWWAIPTYGYPGAHFATFPETLIHRPVIASCPPGGTILDPFCGSGTTLAVAFGNSRSSIGIDLDHRNADLARQRVGMWLEVEGVLDFAAGGPVDRPTAESADHR